MATCVGRLFLFKQVKGGENEQERIEDDAGLLPQGLREVRQANQRPDPKRPVLCVPNLRKAHPAGSVLF